MIDPLQNLVPDNVLCVDKKCRQSGLTAEYFVDNKKPNIVAKPPDTQIGSELLTPLIKEIEKKLEEIKFNNRFKEPLKCNGKMCNTNT